MSFRRLAEASRRMPSPKQSDHPLLNSTPSDAGDIEIGQAREPLTPEAPTTGGEDPINDDDEEAAEKDAYMSLMKLLGDVEERKGVWHLIWIGVELVVISGLTAALACTLKLENMKHRRVLGLRMWQYVMLAIVLCAGLSIIRIITAAFFKAAERYWRLHRHLGYFVRQIKTTVDVTLWFCLILFAWYVWYRPRFKHVYGDCRNSKQCLYRDVSIIAAHQITRFLMALCLGAVLWLCKNTLFLWLEAELHYRQLCDRIARTALQLHVLQILHNYGMWRFLTKATERKKLQEIMMERRHWVSKEEDEKIKKKEDKEWVKGNNICKELLMVKRETVPVLILQRLCKEYRNQIKLKPLPVSKKIIQEPEKLMEKADELFKRFKNPNAEAAHQSSDDDDVSLKELVNKYDKVEIEELELLFRRFRGEQCPHSKINNKKAIPSFAGRVCCCLGVDNRVDETKNPDPNTKIKNGEWSIGRDEFCSWAVQAYRNCWGLQSTLKSSEQIILKLNRMMIAFVLILALIIWLLLSQIVDSAQIALLFSPLLAVKFIFGESTKNMFDGLIFALAMHPFNPGDRVIIQGMELLVTEINILSTTFYKYQTREELVYPNSELANTQIINLELTPDQGDSLEFSIKNTTPLEDIRDLEIRIQMSLDERKDAFKTKVVKTEMGLEDLKMTAHFNYVGSYLTSELKAEHKSEMLSLIMLLIKKMGPKIKEEAPSDPNIKEEAPSTCKPYIVDVTLNKRVKLKQVENIIKVAIKGSLEKHYKDHEVKVVMNNVDDKTVSMACYVWKESKNPTDRKKEQVSDSEEDSPEKPKEHEAQVLISKTDLDQILICILGHIQNPNYECPNGGGGDSSSGATHAAVSELRLEVKELKIQPAPGTLEIKLKDDEKMEKKEAEDMKSSIKRYFYQVYHEDDFEVTISKVDDKMPTSSQVMNKPRYLVDIYAWRKFSHTIEKAKQVDMKQILDANTLKKIQGRKELEKVKSVETLSSEPSVWTIGPIK